MICFSFGGGVQSVAIGCLIVQGRLPKPDIAYIADTGREVRSTWAYLREHMQPHLDTIGLKVEIIPHSFSRVDLYADTGEMLMPAYTADGRMGGFCSGEWKRDTIMRWLRTVKHVKECVQWIGYSMDELRRVPKNDRKKWCQLEFPLIDKFINRTMCYGIIRDAGLPMPRKSRCTVCPHQTNDEWLEVFADPEQWNQAVALDREIREKDPEQSGLYLHSSRVPLELADLGADSPEGKPCTDGGCFT
jgi:hypothetical protein